MLRSSYLLSLFFFSLQSKFCVVYFSDMTELIDRDMCVLMIGNSTNLHPSIVIHFSSCSYNARIVCAPISGNTITSFIYSCLHSFICTHISLTNIYCAFIICLPPSSVIVGTTNIKIYICLIESIWGAEKTIKIMFSSKLEIYNSSLTRL